MPTPRPALRALLLAPAAALLLAGAPARAEVLARVGAAEVTVEEVRAHVASLAPEEREALARDPALLAGLVRAYVASRAVLGEAQARKFDQRPEVKAQLERVRVQTLSELYLQAVSRPPEGYPDDEEVRKAYEANRVLYVAPRSYRLAQIFLPGPKAEGAAGGKAARAALQAADDKVRRRAVELARRLRQPGADFAAAAQAESAEKETAERGGEIGWLTEAQMIPGVREAATRLAKDGVSDPVRIADGYHVLKLLDVQPAAVRPLAEVRDDVVAQLRAEKARALREEYVQKVLGQTEPAIVPGALDKVLAAGK